ncbi:unnamed protein product, partial [Amoebophrya sp. A120]
SASDEASNNSSPDFALHHVQHGQHVREDQPAGAARTTMNLFHEQQEDGRAVNINSACSSSCTPSSSVDLQNKAAQQQGQSRSPSGRTVDYSSFNPQHAQSGFSAAPSPLETIQLQNPVLAPVKPKKKPLQLLPGRQSPNFSPAAAATNHTGAATAVVPPVSCVPQQQKQPYLVSTSKAAGVPPPASIMSASFKQSPLGQMLVVPPENQNFHANAYTTMNINPQRDIMTSSVEALDALLELAPNETREQGAKRKIIEAIDMIENASTAIHFAKPRKQGKIVLTSNKKGRKCGPPEVKVSENISVGEAKKVAPPVQKIYSKTSSPVISSLDQVHRGQHQTRTHQLQHQVAASHPLLSAHSGTNETTTVEHQMRKSTSEEMQRNKTRNLLDFDDAQDYYGGTTVLGADHDGQADVEMKQASSAPEDDANQHDEESMIFGTTDAENTAEINKVGETTTAGAPAMDSNVKTDAHVAFAVQPQATSTVKSHESGPSVVEVEDPDHSSEDEDEYDFEDLDSPMFGTDSQDVLVSAAAAEKKENKDNANKHQAGAQEQHSTNKRKKLEKLILDDELCLHALSIYSKEREIFLRNKRISELDKKDEDHDLEKFLASPDAARMNSNTTNKPNTANASVVENKKKDNLQDVDLERKFYETLLHKADRFLDTNLLIRKFPKCTEYATELLKNLGDRLQSWLEEDLNRIWLNAERRLMKALRGELPRSQREISKQRAVKVPTTIYRPDCAFLVSHEGKSVFDAEDVGLHRAALQQLNDNLFSHLQSDMLRFTVQNSQKTA